MIRRIGRWAAWCATASCALGIALPASAQVFTGRIDITVEDSTGGRLPGVSVDYQGPSIRARPLTPRARRIS